jgi:hypothetical protein
MNDPPYKDASIMKIEDVNHFSKKMLHRLQKIADDLKKTKIDGTLGIRGQGRMTQSKCKFCSVITICCFFFQKWWLISNIIIVKLLCETKQI